VLKKAGEISAAADKNQASGTSQQPTMDIPIVNVPGPDYPDRTPRRGLMKSVGPINQQPKQGLTAPNVTDMSSSGPKMQQVSLKNTHSLVFCLLLFFSFYFDQITSNEEISSFFKILHYTKSQNNPNHSFTDHFFDKKMFRNVRIFSLSQHFFRSFSH
jgi:hypothetical protein